MHDEIRGDGTAVFKRAAETANQVPMRPVIVCLCGSTKFKDAFIRANFDLTMQGKIVLSVGSFGHADAIPFTANEKKRLDKLHLCKIDLSDEIFVLNVGGYVGDSTRREIEYARAINKPVSFLETAIHDR